MHTTRNIYRENSVEYRGYGSVAPPLRHNETDNLIRIVVNCWMMDTGPVIGRPTRSESHQFFKKKELKGF